MIYMMAAGAVLFLLDQATKRVAESRCAARAIRVGPFFSLRPIESRRARYAQIVPRLVLTVLWIAAGAASIALAARGQFPTPAAQIAIGAALGGAAGNLIDILRTRSVRDFIDFGWWPVFNIADVAIIAGLLFAFLPR